MTRFDFNHRLLALAVGAMVALAMVPAPAFAQDIAGRWEIHERDNDRGERLQLNMRVASNGDNWQNGMGIDLDQFQGLSRSDIDNDAENVEFSLVRDAGTIRFEGDFRRGEGTGFFVFIPDPAYASAMADLGYANLRPTRVYQFALQDVSTDFVRELQRLGYDGLPEDDLWKFAIHGVRPEYIRAMNDLGYESIAADDLVRMRIHGVSPDYVRAVRAALQ